MWREHKFLQKQEINCKHTGLGYRCWVHIWIKIWVGVGSFVATLDTRGVTWTAPGFYGFEVSATHSLFDAEATDISRGHASVGLFDKNTGDVNYVGKEGIRLVAAGV